MIQYFRAVSFLEGLSYLTILSVTLGFISRDYVFPIGMGHGVLFILYLFLSLTVSNKQGWSILIWLALFAAAVVPFGFIPVEYYLRKVNQEPIPAQ